MISNPYNSGYVCIQNCNSWEDYTIQEKDTLYNISVKFGVPIRMLMSCNKNINPYNLQVGQVIKVPASKPEALGCVGDSEESYIVELKDTLFTISEKANTTVEELIKMNPGIDPYNLKPGSRICVPKTTAKEKESTIKMTPSQNPPTSDNPSISAFPTQNNAHHMKMQQESQLSTGKPDYQTMPAEDFQGISKAEKPKYKEHNNNEFNGWNNSRNIQSPDSLMNNSSPVNMPIPNTNYAKSNCENSFSTPYIIQEDDSLETIIEKTNLTYASLVFANPGVNFMDLITGSEICIPLWDTFEGCNSGTFYIIKNGDSLASISTRFNVNESALLSANPFNKASDFSTPGIRICIPE